MSNVSTKNINNVSSSGGGIVVKSTDSIPEGTKNLWFTNARAVAAVQADANYKNAEKLFEVPISGPATAAGQILLYNGVTWVPSNDEILNNSNLIISSGSVAQPDAYYARLGPTTFVKPAGTNKTLSIDVPTDGMSGYIELFISSRDTISGVKYQNSDGFFYENSAGTTSYTYVAGFHSFAFTQSISGTKIEIFLNTTNDAQTTLTVTFQTITGIVPTITIP